MNVQQNQDTIENFCKKIESGKAAQVTDDFMIIARIESLILNAGLDDALRRAKTYIEAGADGILIHSRKKEPTEVFKFCKQFASFKYNIPLALVPSTYNHVTEDELSQHGVNIVIYANHLLRAAYPAMVSTAKSILTNQRSSEAENDLHSIDKILEFIPGTK